MQVTIEMPALTAVRDAKTKATRVEIDWSKMNARVMGAILEAGAKVILNNTANGGGKDTSEAERLAKMAKKLDAWYRGEFNVTERGESEVTLLRDAIRARLCNALGVDSVTDTQFRKFQVDTIVKAKGTKPEDGKAVPVDEFIKARAAIAGVDPAELTAALLAEGEAIAKARADAMAEIDVTDIDF